MNDVVFLSGHCDLENESGPSVAHSAVLNTVLSGLMTQVVNIRCMMRSEMLWFLRVKGLSCFGNVRSHCGLTFSNSIALCGV